MRQDTLEPIRAHACTPPRKPPTHQPAAQQGDRHSHAVGLSPVRRYHRGQHTAGHSFRNLPSAPSPPSSGEEGPGQAGARWHHLCCLPDKMALRSALEVGVGTARPANALPEARGAEATTCTALPKCAAAATPHRPPRGGGGGEDAGFDGTRGVPWNRLTRHPGVMYHLALITDH